MCGRMNVYAAKGQLYSLTQWQALIVELDGFNMNMILDF